MSLPEKFNLNWLDDGIRQLVIDINRIPGNSTLTTCEGHIWYDTPAWPTKDGWVHFCTNTDELLALFEEFCDGLDFFTLQKPPYIENAPSIYTVIGHFESHHDRELGSCYSGWSEGEQEKYIARAEVRKVEIQAGWDELDALIREYIAENICVDIDQLPFQ